MAPTSGTGQCWIDMGSLSCRNLVNHLRTPNVNVVSGPGQPGMDDAQLAILQHERLHWQAEAERFNKIVHAQRERIRILEGSPDRLILWRVVKYLSHARFPNLVEASELEKALRKMLE